MPDRDALEARRLTIEEAAERYAKQREWERSQPLGPLVHLRQTHVMRGEGDGTTVYFGRHRGALLVGVHLRGFCGWSSSPTWMPGGWEFFNPTVHVGRLFSDSTHYGSWSCEVKVPARLYRRWKWATSPSWRRAMRERPIQEKQP